jgi:radical SAM protein with 4Fe4S-binding SPASM domain
MYQKASDGNVTVHRLGIPRLQGVKTSHGLIVSPAQRKFSRDKHDTLTRYCRDCDIRFACNGGITGMFNAHHAHADQRLSLKPNPWSSVPATGATVAQSDGQMTIS